MTEYLKFLQKIRILSGEKKEGKEGPRKRGRSPGPDVLAYLGDALFELFVRLVLVQSGRGDSHLLHSKAVKIVNASAQADIFHAIRDSLSPEEIKVFKRGRNSKAGQAPRGTSVTDYRHSTGLETLLGYLLWKEDYQRLEEIFSQIINFMEEKQLLS